METLNKDKSPVDIALEEQRKESEARAILQDLERLITTPNERKRRWVWELIQNAKDSVSISDIENPQKVNITFHLSNNKLTFSHDGSPFALKDLLALVRRTSTKSYNNENGNTGKFGTGFVTTHALNRKVNVSIPLRKKLAINISHLDNNDIKHIPAKVKDVLKGKSGIWVDRVNKKIGFAGTDTALILDGDAIDYFTFQNILPAKGGGYADFIAHIKTGSDLYVFAEDTYYFDQFKQELQQLTHKKVSIPEPYYNC